MGFRKFDLDNIDEAHGLLMLAYHIKGSKLHEDVNFLKKLHLRIINYIIAHSQNNYSTGHIHFINGINEELSKLRRRELNDENVIKSSIKRFIKRQEFDIETLERINEFIKSIPKLRYDSDNDNDDDSDDDSDDDDNDDDNDDENGGDGDNQNYNDFIEFNGNFVIFKY